VEPTGKRVTIRYMDFWKVVDVFNGEGWEAFDRSERTPPAP
jgi:hypothetical protein